LNVGSQAGPTRVSGFTAPIVARLLAATPAHADLPRPDQFDFDDCPPGATSRPT